MLNKFQNKLDPKITEDREIIWKRKVQHRWENQVKTTLAKQPSYDFSDDTYIISILSIWGNYDIGIQQTATFPNRDPFIYLIQAAAIRVLDRRQLRFKNDFIYAVADPDHAGENRFMLLAHGFVEDGLYGYEMNLPVILSKEQDDKDFDLFFALHWAKLDFTDSAQFFDFHLRENFKGDSKEFSSFIHQILWQYETLKMKQHGGKDDIEIQVLTNKHERSFDLWLSGKTFSYPIEGTAMGTANPSNVPESVGTPPVIIQFSKPEVAHALFQTLEPYIDKTQLERLKLILNGKEIDGFLNFKDNGTKLVTFFLKADNMKMLISSKAEVQRWLTKYFKYRNPTSKQFKELNPDYVYGVLTFQHEVKRNVATPYLDAINQ